MLVKAPEDRFHGLKGLRGNASLEGVVWVGQGRSSRSRIHIGVLFHYGALQSRAYLSRLRNQTEVAIL